MNAITTFDQLIEAKVKIDVVMFLARFSTGRHVGLVAEDCFGMSWWLLDSLHLLYVFFSIQWSEAHEYSSAFHLEDKIILNKRDNVRVYAETLNAKQQRGRFNWVNKHT